MLLTLFCQSSIVLQVIRDTRTIKEIPVTIHTTHPRASNGVIEITNHIGDDLFDCTIYVENVDNSSKLAQQLTWDGGGWEINIKNGRSGYLFLHDFWKLLIVERDEDQNAVFDANVHSVELFFRGNTMKNETLSIRIWISVMMKYVGVGVTGEPIYRASADRVETAPPDFG